MTPSQTRALQRNLLAWYRANARVLPWRAQPALYKTVVSELMLQQTQIKTALPYFERWMRELPDFAALAAAPETRVLKLWEGLGYYTRARNLRKLARALAAMPAPPRTPAAWRELPGIGPYTAAAITSITYGEPIACVDGNVVRILSRLAADPAEHRDSAAAAKYFTPLANALIAGARNPGDHNQAMMELGATLCTRAAPQCPCCPLRAHCAAARARAQDAAAPAPETFPRLAPKKYEAQTHTRIWLVRENPITNSQTNAPTNPNPPTNLAINPPTNPATNPPTNSATNPKPKTQTNPQTKTQTTTQTTTQSLLLHRAAPASRRLAGIHELPTPEHLALKPSDLTPQTAPLIATQNRSITRYRITEKVHALTPSRRLARQIETAVSHSRGALQWIPLRDIDQVTLSGPHRRLIQKIQAARLGNGRKASRRLASL